MSVCQTHELDFYNSLGAQYCKKCRVLVNLTQTNPTVNYPKSVRHCFLCSSNVNSHSLKETIHIDYDKIEKKEPLCFDCWHAIEGMPKISKEEWESTDYFWVPLDDSVRSKQPNSTSVNNA